MVQIQTLFLVLSLFTITSKDDNLSFKRFDSKNQVEIYFLNYQDLQNLIPKQPHHKLHFSLSS